MPRVIWHLPLATCDAASCSVKPALEMICMPLALRDSRFQNLAFRILQSDTYPWLSERHRLAQGLLYGAKIVVKSMVYLVYLLSVRLIIGIY